MKINDVIKAYFHRKKSRRDYMTEQIRLLIVGAVIPLPLRPFVQVKPQEPAPTPPSKPKKSGGLKNKTKRKTEQGPVHPLALKFMGESLQYNVTFLWMANAASGTVKFKRDVGKGYVGEVEANAKGFIGWITSHKKQKVTSHMTVEKINGVDRFVTTIYRYESKKGEETNRSTHFFNYKKKRWYKRSYKGDKLHKTSTKKIKGDAPYDDMVCMSYNFRAGVYGLIDYGKKYTVTTIPYKGVSKFSFHVASKDEMGKEKKWIKQHPTAKYMVVIKIDQKIFGIKTGFAKMLGDSDLVPIAATVQDAVSFGNVYADIVRPRAGQSKPDSKAK